MLKGPRPILLTFGQEQKTNSRLKSDTTQNPAEKFKMQSVKKMGKGQIQKEPVNINENNMSKRGGTT